MKLFFITLACRILGGTIPLLILSAAVPAASARTWRIHENGSGDAPTIQAGIDSSGTGDTLQVSPGTYAEDIDFLGKDVVVASVSGPEGTTISGSGGTSPVVWFKNGETRSAVLRGFTITSPNQNGIVIGSSGPSIVNNIVEIFDGALQCFAPPGAVYRPVISNNVFRDSKYNPAISVYGNQVPEIANNLVSGNEEGGIYIWTAAPGALITGNRIIGNKSNVGAGIFASWNGSPGLSGFTISWNLIARNELVPRQFNPVFAGSGMFLRRTGAWVHHNTVIDNPLSYAYFQGVVVLQEEAGLLLSQNIIALNRGTGIVCLDSDAQIRNNLVWENTPSDFNDQCASIWPGNGNVVADPYFCDPANRDYSLARNSPAITHVAGPLGAIPIPGCGPVAVERTTWGRLKARYGSGP